MRCPVGVPYRRLRVHCVRYVAVLAVITLEPHLPAANAADPESADAMEKFLAQPAIPHEYRALRYLEAAGVGQRGWLDVETSFSVRSGLVYNVTAEGGSSYIRSRVLRSLLDEEQRLIALGATAAVALSRDNYHFTPEGINEHRLAVVTLKPLRKDRALIVGEMFLSPLEGELVRVEGRLASNPSFWVTRVNVTRSYRRINGVRMPVSLETTAQLRLLGSSTLRMTYQYSHIDDRPVDTEHAHGESAEAECNSSGAGLVSKINGAPGFATCSGSTSGAGSAVPSEVSSGNRRS